MKLLFPIQSEYHVTQNFGEQGLNYTGLIPSGRHDGVDIAAKRGTPIVAPDDGVVKRLYKDAKPDVGGYGNFVRIFTKADQPGLFYDQVFGHFLTVFVSEGQEVKRGEVLGLVDSTGYSTGDHLHWGIRMYKDADIVDYNNGYYGYFDFSALYKPVPDAVFEVDNYYGQTPSPFREILWRRVHEKYAKRRAFLAGIPYTDRIMKAHVYGYWDAATVYSAGNFALWVHHTKPGWAKLLKR